MAAKKKPKTYWNYRVIRTLGHDGVPYYGIHEVYYNEEGKPTAMTENAVDVGGDTKSEIKSVLNGMKRALSKKILNPGDIGTR